MTPARRAPRQRAAPPLTLRAPRAQNCALGFGSAAAAAALEPAALLQRAAQVVADAARANAALAWRAPTAERPPCFNLATLPRAVALRILVLVPVDARARASLVCRAWRELTSDCSLWRTLDLSERGFGARGVTAALLRGAAARAGGGLTALNLTGRDFAKPDARLAVVAQNGASLRELRLTPANELSYAVLEQLALAAPRLQLFEAGASVSMSEAILLLRNTAPFGALRLNTLTVFGRNGGGHQGIPALAAALTGQQALESLRLTFVPLDTALVDTLVTAAVACRLRSLFFTNCRLTPASVPALSRLIRGGALSEISVFGITQRLLDADSAPQLASAFAASRSLSRVVLHCVDLFHDAAVYTPVLAALTGHPTLRDLYLSGNDVADPAAAAAVGAALGALVAANSPALRELSFGCCFLGDEGVAPVLDALPQNTHLLGEVS